MTLSPDCSSEIRIAFTYYFWGLMLLPWAGMPKLELTLPQLSCRKGAHLSCYMAGRILRPTPLQLRPCVTAGLGLLVAVKKCDFFMLKIAFLGINASRIGRYLTGVR